MNFKWDKKGTEAADAAFSVRLKVFVEEQGFSQEAELDKIDDIAFHLTGFDQNGTAICAARLFCEHGIWHAGRIAVDKACRGTGAGRLLMQQISEKAKELGADRIVLGAQYDKTGFYEKCGYIKTGKKYLDEGYPHEEMELLI